MEGDRKPVPFLRGPFGVAQGRISPDGRWLAYTSEESGRSEIYVQPFPGGGGKWQISTAGGNDPRWRADGRELYYQSPNQQMMAVTIRTSPGLEADVPISLFTANVLVPGTAVRSHYAVTTDAQRFLLAAPSGRESVSGTQVVLNWSAEVKRR
jgi:hypothetical protein